MCNLFGTVFTIAVTYYSSNIYNLVTLYVARVWANMQKLSAKEMHWEYYRCCWIMWSSTTRASMSAHARDTNNVQDTWYFHMTWTVSYLERSRWHYGSFQCNALHSRGRGEAFIQFGNFDDEIRYSTTIGNQKEFVYPVNNSLIGLIDVFTNSWPINSGRHRGEIGGIRRLKGSKHGTVIQNVQKRFTLTFQMLIGRWSGNVEKTW